MKYTSPHLLPKVIPSVVHEHRRACLENRRKLSLPVQAELRPKVAGDFSGIVRLHARERRRACQHGPHLLFLHTREEINGINEGQQQRTTKEQIEQNKQLN